MAVKKSVKKKEEKRVEFKPTMIGSKTYGQAYFDTLGSGNYNRTCEIWTDKESKELSDKYPLNGLKPELSDIDLVRLGVKLHRLPSHILKQWQEMGGKER